MSLYQEVSHPLTRKQKEKFLIYYLNKDRVERMKEYKKTNLRKFRGNLLTRFRVKSESFDIQNPKTDKAVPTS